jgi:metal-responsive CopG/Arc/MetJ family transcriptional regulator
MMPPMKRTNLYLPTQLLIRLKDKARETGYSVSELVRQAIERFLTGEKK